MSVIYQAAYGGEVEFAEADRVFDGLAMELVEERGVVARRVAVENCGHFRQQAARFGVGVVLGRGVGGLFLGDSSAKICDPTAGVQ